MSNRKRLCLYSYSDPAPIADRYVLRLLDELRGHCGEVSLVCHGSLTPDARESLQAHCDRLMVCEEANSPLAAYEKALSRYESEALSAFDEILCLSDSLMGPCRPLSELFSAMDGRELDFWCLCPVFSPEKSDGRGAPDPALIAFRRSVFENGRLAEALQAALAGKMSAPDGALSALLTRSGYRWDSYVKGAELSGFVYDPLRYAPLRLVRDYRCPFFSREIFSLPGGELYSLTDKSEAGALLRYLEEERLYDTDLVWEQLLRRCHMAALIDSLGLQYIVPREGRGADGKPPFSTALVLYLQDREAVTAAYPYALSMPEGSDLYLLCGSEETRSAAETAFCNGAWRKKSFFVQEQPSLFFGPELGAYELVCFAGLEAEGGERTMENVLASRGAVDTILSLFAAHARLGVLTPRPDAAAAFPDRSEEWTQSFARVKGLCELLALRCPLSAQQRPAAVSGAFWCRPAALEKLLGQGGAISLPDSELLVPLAAQDALFYTAWVLTDERAAAEWAELSYRLREINVRAFRAFGYHSFIGLRDTMERFAVYPTRRTLSLAEIWPLAVVKIKRRLPKKLKKRLGELYAALKKAVRNARRA